MRQVAPPFLAAPPKLVEHGGWLIATSSGGQPLSQAIDHWDYQRELHLACSMRIERSRLLETCELGDQTTLEILVTTESEATRAQEVLTRVEVPPSYTVDLDVTGVHPGSCSGGMLSVHTVLVATDPRPLSTLAASRPGSILWKVRHRTALEGIGAQFPTGAEDFSGTARADSRAGWELQIDLSDPDASAMAAIRLTLNSGMDQVRTLLDESGGTQGDLVRRMLTWDITRQMVHAALRNEEVLALDVDPEATSVGGVLRNLLASIWPNVSPVTVGAWLKNEPHRIETDIQAYSRVVAS